MSTSLRVPLPVTKIQVGEIRVNLLPTPTAWSRIAYVTEDGNTIGDTTFSAWSKDSWELLVALTEQVERDLAEWMASKSVWSESEDTGSHDEGPEDQGLDFSG